MGAWPAASAGSSPLARGLQSGRVTSSHNWQDHPRSRGVYRAASGRRSMTSGSSPLARGLLDRGHYRRGRRGIIPARAGFTPVGADDSPKPGDHPRSRGVYSTGITRRIQVIGSSPLARGLRRCHLSILDRSGIIPARAGFTTGLDAKTEDVEGSSPLARGLRGVDLHTVVGDRIIPARAGFTGLVYWAAHQMGDHPRSRGVYCHE